MPRPRIFNADLRSFILHHAIRQESLAGEILKFIFRILKNETKTLGNKSSSLSFRNKVDLLMDFGDISSEENKNFTKLLEIRNQFALNANCVSFIKLKDENSQLTDFISQKFPNMEIEIEKGF